MRAKLKASMAGPEGTYPAGHIFSGPMAEQLVRDGQADELPDEAPVVDPNEPDFGEEEVETADVRPPANAAGRKRKQK